MRRASRRTWGRSSAVVFVRNSRARRKPNRPRIRLRAGLISYAPNPKPVGRSCSTTRRVRACILARARASPTCTTAAARCSTRTSLPTAGVAPTTGRSATHVRRSPHPPASPAHSR
jgi:hypothetical protein